MAKSQWKDEIRFGPTYRFVHTTCGRKAKKVDTDIYHCPNCDKTTSDKSGLVRKHRV